MILNLQIKARQSNSYTHKNFVVHSITHLIPSFPFNICLPFTSFRCYKGLGTNYFVQIECFLVIPRGSRILIYGKQITKCEITFTIISSLSVILYYFLCILSHFFASRSHTPLIVCITCIYRIFIFFIVYFDFLLLLLLFQQFYPPAVAGRVRPSGSFLGTGLLVFSQTIQDIRSPYRDVRESRIFWKNPYQTKMTKNGKKWPQNRVFQLFRKTKSLLLISNYERFINGLWNNFLGGMQIGNLCPETGRSS